MKKKTKGKFNPPFLAGNLLKGIMKASEAKKLKTNDVKQENVQNSAKWTKLNLQQ